MKSACIPFMKPFKLLACLVTLTFCGFPLYSAAADELRTWTDVQGRKIEARVLAVDLTKETVRIERADGATFELPLLRFSPADRVYAKVWADNHALAADGLRELTTENWDWLTRSGSMQTGRYIKVPAKEFAAILNTRIANARLKTEKGSLTGLRIEEDSELGAISAEITGTVSYASFLRELAKANNLRLLVDASGAIVIRRSGGTDTTPTQDGEKIEFLGITSS